MRLIGSYLRGNSLTIVQRFRTIDPITCEPVLADPATVTFTIRNPDGVEVTYVYGVDVNVTKQAVGVYLCALATPLPPGDYGWAAVGTAIGPNDAQATGEGTFTILGSGVLPPSFATVADYGPCSGWVDGAFVAEFDTTLGLGSSSYLLDTMAEAASQLMYELTARQFSGNCRRTVRPCRQSCSCFGASTSLGLGPWLWTSAWGVGGFGAFGWQNECGDACGCGSESYVKLAGYPVQSILEVKIDGVVIAATPGPAPDGNPAHAGGYRLDDRRNLIRLADVSNPGAPVSAGWPACQDLSLPDTEPGTYSVTYEWGQAPPELGRLAAAQLAVELWKSQPQNGGVCRLPNRVSRVTRGGVTMDRLVPLAELLRAGATGLSFVDAFVAMVNPQGAKRRSAVFSPDVQPFARKLGQGE